MQIILRLLYDFDLPYLLNVKYLVLEHFHGFMVKSGWQTIVCEI